MSSAVDYKPDTFPQCVKEKKVYLWMGKSLGLLKDCNSHKNVNHIKYGRDFVFIAWIISITQLFIVFNHVFFNRDVWNNLPPPSGYIEYEKWQPLQLNIPSCPLCLSHDIIVPHRVWKQTTFPTFQCSWRDGSPCDQTEHIKGLR